MPAMNAGGPPPRRRSAECRAAGASSPTVRASFSCASRGQIVVVEGPNRKGGYLVAWRRDGRFRKSITVLKRIRDRGLAMTSAASLADRYVPPPLPAFDTPRDGQRKAVYSWENMLDQGAPVFPAQMQAVCDRVCAYFGVRPVPVRSDRRLQRASFFSPSSGIVIASGMNDEATLWHEIAHYLVWKMGVREASHGPVFVSTLISIRVLFGKQSCEFLVASARSRHIDLNIDLLGGLIGWSARAAA